ncbi:hypothetical protein NQ314_001023 [Rhamnusium bicolor]|uniref:THAP-type domain-containing protein n=1 Tax=Rhamnusium bicolor TaxID=1586634 RepID=A0AAV8ZWF0_9CUCU|nr:hypothetical protein NQ314_001023 [Rhamnusium bicolor]
MEEVSPYDVLCSDHFSSGEIYQKSFTGKKFLKKGAMPCSKIQKVLFISDDDADSADSEKENKNIGETSKKKVQFMPDVTKHVPIVGTSSESDGLGEEEIPKKRLKLHQQIISPLSMASESSDHSEKSVAGSSSTLPPSPTKSDTSINKTSSTLTASEAESDIKLKPKRRRKPLPRYFGDYSSDDMNSPRRAKRIWAIATKTISQLKARVRKFRRENYILKSRVDSLTSLFSYLRTNNYLNKSAEAVI